MIKGETQTRLNRRRAWSQPIMGLAAFIALWCAVSTAQIPVPELEPEEAQAVAEPPTALPLPPPPPTVEERAARLIAAESIESLEFSSSAFLQEVIGLLVKLAETDAATAAGVYDKAGSLYSKATADGTWTARFPEGIELETVILNSLLENGKRSSSVKVADFCLSMLQRESPRPLFLDQPRIAALFEAVAYDLGFGAVEKLSMQGFEQLVSGLSVGNLDVPVAGYHSFLEELTSDDSDDLDEVMAIMTREAASNDTKRASLARHLFTAAKIRKTRLTNNDATNARLGAETDSYAEWVADEKHTFAARLLVAQSILYEAGDVLGLKLHQEGWRLLGQGLRAGTAFPSQTVSMLTFADSHKAAQGWSEGIKGVSTAWSEQLAAAPDGQGLGGSQDQFAVQLTRLLLKLSIAGNDMESAQALTSLPIRMPDLSWLVAMLQYGDGDGDAAANYFGMFWSYLDLRYGNGDLPMCVFSRALEKRAVEVAAQLDDPSLQWLLRVVVAALPDDPMSSPSSRPNFRPRERRLEKLAEEHAALTMGQPQLEQVALRWICEEYGATHPMKDAYSKAGQAIGPNAFLTMGSAVTAEGNRRIVSTWLRQSLSGGPASSEEFLKGFDNSPPSQGTMQTVASLANALHDAFDDDGLLWKPEVRQQNLVLFRLILSRQEMGRVPNSDFIGRFASVALVYHALDGKADDLNTTWEGFTETQRRLFLLGEDGFLNWFDDLMRDAAEGRNFDAAAMEVAVRGIHSSPLYWAMAGESFGGSKIKDFFADAKEAGILNDEVLLNIGVSLATEFAREGYAWKELAQVQEEAGQIDAAVASWEKLSEAVPRSSNSRYTEAQLNKTTTLEKAQRFDDALAALKGIDTKRLDATLETDFQNRLREMRILMIGEKRGPKDMLRFAAKGLEFQPTSTKGRFSAAAVFRALRIKAESEGDKFLAWACAYLGASTLRDLEREETGITTGSAKKSVELLNVLHVSNGKPGGILTLIPKGAPWRYRDAGDSGGADWNQPSFDDSAWTQGAAPFGYGNGLVKTTVESGGSGKSRSVTTYFRRRFQLPESETARRAVLMLLRDDGAIVYLNGEEIRRDNMGAGVLTAKTMAERKTSGSEERLYVEGAFSPERLKSGENVIAVEVHQYDQDSSDLVFDVELIVNDIGEDALLDSIDLGDVRDALGELWELIPISIKGALAKARQR